MIQWFPGHMTKALREMECEIKKIDVVLYVLDSRAPLACLNPKFSKLTGDKPIIYVFSKFDICDSNKTMQFAKSLLKENVREIFVDSTKSGSSKEISNLVCDLCRGEIEKNRAKGLNTILKCMVIGVPNCGKSTLINNICGQSRAVTGNKPGVTKGKQWVKISNQLEVLDTPGTLWPSFDNIKTANYLAFIGSIKDDVVDTNEVCLELVSYLLSFEKEKIFARYSYISTEKSPLDVVEKIATERKYVLRGGEIDYDRVCRAILDDFRKGKIGNITFL